MSAIGRCYHGSSTASVPMPVPPSTPANGLVGETPARVNAGEMGVFTKKQSMNAPLASVTTEAVTAAQCHGSVSEPSLTDQRVIPPDGTSSTSFLHSPLVDQIRETEALEELIREETIRHLEAAWKAQRRLARACFMARASSNQSQSDRREKESSN